MNESLTTTKERVLEAAMQCNDAKATLKILFPEVFEEGEEKQVWINIESFSKFRVKGKTITFFQKTDEPKKIEFPLSKPFFEVDWPYVLITIKTK